MNRLHGHRRHGMPIRLFCLVLMAVLSASPLLAAVSTLADCDRQCCCCADTRHGPTVKVYRGSGMGSSCCDSTSSRPCHMSDDNLPESPLALVQTAPAPPVRSTPLLLDLDRTGARAFVAASFIPWADNGPRPIDSPIYLQTCRLIC